VKNQADGTVYIEASGNDMDIKSFIEWCHQGSPSSEVNKVTVEILHPTNFNGFEIRK